MLVPKPPNTDAEALTGAGKEVVDGTGADEFGATAVMGLTAELNMLPVEGRETRF